MSLSKVNKEFGFEFCFEAPNGSVKWYKATALKASFHGFQWISVRCRAI